MKVIMKIGLAIISNGRILVVREHSGRCFLMPGGRPEGEETEIDALEREVTEELSCSLDRNSLEFLGEFSDKAAEQRRAVVRVRLYAGRLMGVLKPSSEIAELRWFDPRKDDCSLLAPSIRNKILPYLEEHSYI